jgi:hypothetical protein
MCFSCSDSRELGYVGIRFLTGKVLDGKDIDWKALVVAAAGPLRKLAKEQRISIWNDHLVR